MSSSSRHLLLRGLGVVHCLCWAANASNALPVSSACALCLHGEDIASPEKAISIPGFEFVNNCQALKSLVPIFQQGTDQCDLLQSIGTLCGCPKQENACNLCQDNSQVQYGWRPLPFLADMYGGIIPTCELVEAGLHSYNKTDPTCLGSRLMFPEYCGCGAEPGSQPSMIDDQSRCNLCFNIPEGGIPLPEKVIDIDGFPFRTCGALANASITLFKDTPLLNKDSFFGNTCWMMRQLAVSCGCDSIVQDSPCHICRQEQSFEVPFPDRRLPSTLTKFFLGDMEMSCGVLADVARQYSSVMEELVPVCNALQGLGTKCGCALPLKPICEICKEPLSNESLGKTISNVPPLNLITCGFSELASMYMSDGAIVPFGENGSNIEFQCWAMQYGGFTCGCNNGFVSYWGADTLSKQIAVVWLQRVSAILSLVGSLAIVVDILTSKKLGASFYRQVMLGLSMFDILSSIAWGLGPLPSVSNLSSQEIGDIDIALFPDAEGARIYGSQGTEATCKAQGFMLHLGFTSILFNLVLSYYFKRTVVDGKRDSSFLLSHRVILLGAPIIVGFGVALAAIPYIGVSPVGCMIAPQNKNSRWLKTSLLFFVPYGSAFIYMPLNTFYIYWKFRSQMRKSETYRLSVISMECRSAASHNRETNELQDARPSKKRRHGMRSQEKKHKHVEVAVFWQAFWYVAAFYASYFIYVLTFAFDGYRRNAYWFYVLLAIFTPMQGFFNSLVYFRPRKGQWLEMLKRIWHDGLVRCWEGILRTINFWRWKDTELPNLLKQPSPRLSEPTRRVPCPVNCHHQECGRAKTGGVQFSSGGLPPSELSEMDIARVHKTQVSNSSSECDKAESIVTSNLHNAALSRRTPYNDICNGEGNVVNNKRAISLAEMVCENPDWNEEKTEEIATL